LANNAYERLKTLGIVLPPPTRAAGNYSSYVCTGKLVFISGQGPFADGRMIYRGRVGKDISIADAQKAAKYAAINLLSQLEVACGGNLNQVRQLVRLMGCISCASDFYQLPTVLDGASDLLMAVFEEKGRHARYPAGVSTLPFNAPVTLELVAEIE
jgi:enamine deaminase RidA (YjgF/YER057c/UK114 family)